MRGFVFLVLLACDDDGSTTDDGTISDEANDFEIDWDGAVAGYDEDNDGWVSGNCASGYVVDNGGFWYDNCYETSMLHANSSVYSWAEDTTTSVSYLYLYFREE